jgi:hypothetical protein
MSKKRDFIRDQQSRDKHPESGMTGSAADLADRGLKGMNRDLAPQDRQAAHSGKNANDHNKQGEQVPTQKNEGRRTPDSRHDREAHIGGDNQSRMRKGTPTSR